MKLTHEEILLAMATIGKGLTYILAMIALLKFIFWM
jgi:hypothetical protein